MAKTKAEKEAEAKAKLEVAQDAVGSDDPILDSDLDAVSDEDIAAQAETAQAAMKENLKRASTAQVPKDEQVYTESQVRQMLEQVMKGEGEDDDEQDLPKIVRLPRFQNKFILGFKNMNEDEYTKDSIVHAVDIFNEKIGKNIPWVTLIFEDGSELAIPLETILKQSTTVKCELANTKEKDASYDFGKVERQEVKPDSYKKEGTGQFIKTKVTQKTYTFEVKLPNGKVVTVGPEVLNWKL